MKISNSKKELARIISENGGWRDGAGFVAQDKLHGGRKNNIGFYRMRPILQGGDHSWRTHKDDCGGIIGGWIDCEKLISNWHQTILSRAEYFHLYPAQDADGWIEWNGVAKSPAAKGVAVDVKMKDGTQHFCQLIDDDCWSGAWGDESIIAYRLPPAQAGAGEG